MAANLVDRTDENEQRKRDFADWPEVPKVKQGWMVRRRRWGVVHSRCKCCSTGDLEGWCEEPHLAWGDAVWHGALPCTMLVGRTLDTARERGR
jgi:hypothetical protein